MEQKIKEIVMLRKIEFELEMFIEYKKANLEVEKEELEELLIKLREYKTFRGL